MNGFTNFCECFKSRVVLAPQATGTGAEAYLTPTAGTKGIVLRCVAKMGNAADLVLSLKYADDASGTNAAAFGATYPIYVNGARVTDAKTYTIGDASGNFIVDFAVDPANVPEGKFVGVSYGNSNAGNLLSVTMIEDAAYCPVA